MTHTQWMFEYESLMEREREEEDKAYNMLKVFRISLIRLLGLDLLADNSNESADKFDVNFIPLSMLVSRREVTESIINKMEQETKTKNVLEDNDFDRLSAAIASGDIGDMDPIIAGPDPETLRKFEETNRHHQLESAGVKLVNGISSTNMQHLQVNSSKLTEKILKAKEQKRQLEQEIADVLKEGTNHDKNDIMMSFDNDRD